MPCCTVSSMLNYLCSLSSYHREHTVFVLYFRCSTVSSASSCISQRTYTVFYYMFDAQLFLLARRVPCKVPGCGSPRLTPRVLRRGKHMDRQGITGGWRKLLSYLCSSSDTVWVINWRRVRRGDIKTSTRITSHYLAGKRKGKNNFGHLKRECMDSIKMAKETGYEGTARFVFTMKFNGTFLWILWNRETRWPSQQQYCDTYFVS